MKYNNNRVWIYTYGVLKVNGILRYFFINAVCERGFILLCSIVFCKLLFAYQPRESKQISVSNKHCADIISVSGVCISYSMIEIISREHFYINRAFDLSRQIDYSNTLLRS